MDEFTQEESWQDFFNQETSKPYFIDLMKKVDALYERVEVLPKYEDMFRAFKGLGVKDIKCVIVGQDPYPTPGDAHGLAFSCKSGIPKSLANIFVEVKNEYPLFEGYSGDLSGWQRQGVFLLNRILTVEAYKPLSHQHLGWKIFSQHVLEYVSEHCDHVVFCLWGKNAQEVIPFIDSKKHTLLLAPHPSPLSAYRGFFGCDHFRLVNDALKAHLQDPIDWCAL